MAETKVKSFKDFDRDELAQIADEEFAVEFDQDATHSDILSAMLEQGVTWQMYLNNHPESEDEEPEAVEEPKRKAGRPAKEKLVAPQEKILVKMTRENGTFEIRGVRFTKQHPFMLVDEDDADWILTHIEGFHIATPSEAKEYYS